jgi:O-antigen/teichoic acid export membrane protein
MSRLKISDRNPSTRSAGVRRIVSSVHALKSLITTKSEDRGRERYRRAGITASTSFLSKALTIAIGFISVPLTLHYLGPQRYGVWLTISSLLTWMALTDFGLAGNALVNVIAEAHGKDDQELAREYSASAFWSLIAISAVLGLVFLAIFHLTPWRSVFRVSTEMSTQELHQACALTLGLFVLGLPLNMLYSIYGAYQDGFVSNVWAIASNTFALVSLILVTQFRGGLPLLILALSGTRMAVLLASGGYAFFFRYPWLLPTPRAVRWARIKRLLSLGGKYMVTQLASLGMYQSQPIIITQFLGPAQVMMFVVSFKIITLPLDLAYMATVPFISAFAEAKARGDWNWIKGAYKNSVIASVAIGIPVIATLGLAAKSLIRVWASPAAVPDWPLILWLSIYTLIGVVLMSAGQLLCGLERLGPLALSLALCALGVVGLGILFVHWWGLTGIALAMAVSKLFTFWPIQVHNVRGILRNSGTRTSDGEHQFVVKGTGANV